MHVLSITKFKADKKPSGNDVGRTILLLLLLLLLGRGRRLALRVLVNALDVPDQVGPALGLEVAVRALVRLGQVDLADVVAQVAQGVGGVVADGAAEPVRVVVGVEDLEVEQPVLRRGEGE